MSKVSNLPIIKMRNAYTITIVASKKKKKENLKFMRKKHIL